jgi:iron complex transport system substrate-binding protein
MMEPTVTTRSERIVSLLPSATEIVYALGLGERLVGVTHECDYPPEAKSKPVLTASALPTASTSAEIDRHVRRHLHQGSSIYTLDAELLERLAPDLILTQELCAVCAVSYDIVARAAKQLRGDPRIVSLEPSSLEDVYANIATVGELSGAIAEAAAVVGKLRSRVELLRKHVAEVGTNGTKAAEVLEPAFHASIAQARPRTLVLEWTDPPMSGGHWTPGLVELAGGEAILANPGANSQVLAWEAIAEADPDVILVAPCGFDLAKSFAAVDELAASNPTWRSLRAVRERRAHVIDGNAYVNRPGPRLVDSAEIFASAIGGECYGAAISDRNALRSAHSRGK